MLAPLLAAVVVAAPDQEPPRPLEFRTDVRMIRLDVSVVDRRGRPLPGLIASDFEVFEDGRPVEIALFEAIEERGDAALEVGFVVAAEPGPAGPPRRRILLLVDTEAMSAGQLLRARASAARYLREGTAGGDWVRLVNLSTGEAWDGSMPEDRSRLAAAAGRLVQGGSPWTGGTSSDAIQDRVESRPGKGGSESQTSGQFLSVFAQASGLLGTLESLLVQLDGVLGRKALVLVSPGFPQLRDLDARLQKVASLARQAATAVYFVDAAGLDGLTPEPGGSLVPAFEAAWSRSGGAQDLAEATGGFTARFSNSLLPALKRVGDEMRTYYVVGYVPERPQDGRFRTVKVRVSAPGATARTKKGYLARAAYY